MMNKGNFMSLINSRANRFIEGIRSGAAWEIAAQAEIFNALVDGGFSIAREISYPGSRENTDFAFHDQGTIYLVELKVESANQSRKFAGESMTAALNSDKTKLAGFNVADFIKGTDLILGSRWVVFIAYSAGAKDQMPTLFTNWADDMSGTIRVGIADI